VDLEYKRLGKAFLSSIINGARIVVKEETEFDNSYGTIYGHDVVFFLSEEVLGTMSFEDQKLFCDIICSDLNVCRGDIGNEYFRKVIFELTDENDDLFQSSAPYSNKPILTPDNLSIWRPGYIRLFISHRDKHKAEVKHLAEALGAYDISAFVAHDTIQPMTIWQHEILVGLKTMEIMLAFVTDDFSDSVWTNQEIGFALGKDIPVIPLKLESADPPGFISSTQALKGDLKDTASLASDIFRLISQKLRYKEHFKKIIINRFISSSDYKEAEVRFKEMKSEIDTLSDENLLSIVQGFKQNSQLHKCYHLTDYSRLKEFLENRTNKRFLIKGNDIIILNQPKSSEEVSF
jgi:hypothetical protein